MDKGNFESLKRLAGSINTNSLAKTLADKNWEKMSDEQRLEYLEVHTRTQDKIHIQKTVKTK